MPRKSVSARTRKKFERVGNRLISKRATTGFQIEKIPNKRSRHVYYGHSDPKHTQRIKRRIPSKSSKITPRTSYYLWKKEWGKPSRGTTLTQRGKLAKEKGHYVRIKGDPKKNVRWLRKNATTKLKGAYKKRTKRAIVGSWDVPDIRVIKSKRRVPSTKKAFLVVKKINKGNRLSTIVTNRTNLAKVRKVLKHERVKVIKVQDYRPKKSHSFWRYIDKRG